VSGFSIAPRGPFSLDQAARRFFRGWAATEAAEGGPVPLALVRDDLAGTAGVSLREEDGALVGEVSGADDVDAVARQVARVMSLDHDGSGYPAVGARDPVVGRAMAAAPGLRPVLFHTPYEAAVWAVLSQRTAMAQAAAARRRLSERFGQPLVVAGRETHAFPLPEELLAAPELPGVPSVKAAWLRGIAEAALEGRLDAEMLRALPPDEARAELRTIPGIGPFSADLVLLRGCGTADVLSPHEPRLRRIVGGLYGVDPDDDEALAAVAEGWRPFRTWVSVLLRAVAQEASSHQGAGDR
jgi:DNA-3-methyladenine glycosylase II